MPVVEILKRSFRFNDETLPDPDPGMSVAEVMDFYSGKYPELTSGVAKEPEMEDGVLVYEIDFVLGDKG